MIKTQTDKEQWWRGRYGEKDQYDRQSGEQFALLMHLGMREHHKLLELGAASLGLGRLCMMYLQENNYSCTEPDHALMSAGIINEVTPDIIQRRQPTFISFCPAGWHDVASRKEWYEYIAAFNWFQYHDKLGLRHQILCCAQLMKPASYLVGYYLEAETSSYPMAKTGTAGRTYPKVCVYSQRDMEQALCNAGLRMFLLDGFLRTYPQPNGSVGRYFFAQVA